MKVIYMGTPDIAVSVLESIIEAGHDVVAVVTQTDKPKGRGGKVQFPPVKEAALDHNIPVYQPARIKNNREIEEILKSYNADIIVVVAYGQILPASILYMTPLGCVNVHASLLPKYRGAAPIQWSIIDGEKKTGVTTMLMNEGLDTGDMLDVVEVEITDSDTAGTLHDKLAEAGGKVIVETMKKLEQGTATPVPQRDEDSCYAKMLNKELGNLDFCEDADKIERLVRGLNPWPCAYTTYNGKTMKIWNTKVLSEEEIASAKEKIDYNNVECGTVVAVTKDYFAVKAGNGVLAITELQIEGKKRMETKAFLAGVKICCGEKLERKRV